MTLSVLFCCGHRTVWYTHCVTPEAASRLQIERYRRMTGEERLAIALDLHDLACDIAREGIRAQHPDADAAEVERLLARRFRLLGSPA